MLFFEGLSYAVIYVALKYYVSLLYKILKSSYKQIARVSEIFSEMFWLKSMYGVKAMVIILIIILLIEV